MRSIKRRSLCSCVLLVLVASACAPHDVATVDVKPTAENRVDFDVVQNRDIDILFVIDDSLSMDSEQRSIARNFPRMIQRLQEVEGGLPNVHIGVISTDVGAGDYPSDGCSVAGKNGQLQSTPREPGCSPPSGAFISDVEDDDGNRQRNYAGDLAETFSCIARLGTNGCGFEQPLEAMRRALNRSNPSNTGFLREEALLAVIFITDEDDCSTENTAMFAPDTDPDGLLGPKRSFRCFEFGVSCDVANARDVGPRSDCRPRDDSPYMFQVQEYVDFLRGLKGADRKILVAGIIGNESPVGVSVDSDGFPALDYSCGTSGDDAQAVPPVRLAAFLRAFVDPAIATICDENLSSALDQIAEAIVLKLDASCVPGNLADLDATAPGIQPDCAVSETRPDTGETVLGVCDDMDQPERSSLTPCYVIAPDTDACGRTPTNLRVTVYRRPNETVPPDTRVVARCLGG